ncbi:hypothetical protein JTE90_005117 [Oedothorax gibbosus]|uniref:Uncharacterized protein n=1 Tax=Oedothorax gibbosus TaxID=931172 RepID=A0AAV6UNF6_9ARAC|nr:hypothetical protein JTE90_005117 [Oedothorax gibbosus]
MAYDDGIPVFAETAFFLVKSSYFLQRVQCGGMTNAARITVFAVTFFFLAKSSMWWDGQYHTNPRLCCDSFLSCKEFTMVGWPMPPGSPSLL